MGVLRESANFSVATVSKVATKGQDFIVAELGRTKQNVVHLLDMFPNFPCQIAKSAADSIIAVIDQILLLQPIAWSKQKLFALYSKLMTHMETLIMTLADYVTPPMESVYALLKDAFEKITGFVALTFEKLDDSLVTPVVMTGYNGVKKTYILTTDFAHARYVWVKDTLVLPVTSTVSNYVVMPIYKRVTGAASCVTSTAIQTGAMIDKRLSLVGMCLALVEKSKEVDQCVTKGAITNRVVVPALEKAKSFDEKFVNGAGQGFIYSSIDEFQVAKGNKPIHGRTVTAGNVTSAGPPQYRK